MRFRGQRRLKKKVIDSYRDDMDVVKFFEYDKAALIERIKKECAYTD